MVDGDAELPGTGEQARRESGARHAQRRGSVVELQLEEILELDTALDKLNAAAPRLRLVVELRFFCGPPRTRSVGRWASRHERSSATGSRRGSSCSRSSHQ